MSSRQMPGAGERNNLVTILRPDDGADEFGQPVGTYSFVDKVWADVKPATAREYVASRQAEAAIDVIVKAPYRTDVLATWIIMYEGQLYDIQSTAQIGYREGLQILCRVRQQ